ncbi:MAG: CPBP family intramembrane metalloprotease [Atopobiaceae bacterium]|nr:CPBP family intramembrane metalloprotease [Atopobiaceae bacterium]
MLGLYRRNETLFAVLWIVLYVVVCGNLRNLGDDSPYMTVGLLAMALSLLRFVMRNELAGKYGLTSWPKNQARLLYLVPLWAITSGNLWGGVSPHYEGPGLVCAVISMALVGILEELIFRGLLFKAMLAKGSDAKAIVICAVTFGIGHIVNLLTGHLMLETLVQIVFAVSVGFVFTLVFYRGGSLLPPMLAHSLIDVFSLASNREGVLGWAIVAISILVAIAYSIYLWRLDTTGDRR